MATEEYSYYSIVNTQEGLVAIGFTEPMGVTVALKDLPKHLDVSTFQLGSRRIAGQEVPTAYVHIEVKTTQQEDALSENGVYIQDVATMGDVQELDWKLTAYGTLQIPYISHTQHGDYEATLVTGAEVNRRKIQKVTIPPAEFVLNNGSRIELDVDGGEYEVYLIKESFPLLEGLGQLSYERDREIHPTKKVCQAGVEQRQGGFFISTTETDIFVPNSVLVTLPKIRIPIKYYVYFEELGYYDWISAEIILGNRTPLRRQK